MGKDRGRPFKQGNPGRPPGSKNKTTQVLEQLAEGQAEQLLRKVIEQALAGLSSAGPWPAAKSAEPKAPAAPPKAAPPAPRSGPSPFELDRAKKAQQSAPPTVAESSPAPGPQPPAPASEASDWRERLHRALTELNMPFTADAVENSRIVEVSGELQFTTSAAYKLALRPDDLGKALKHLNARPLRIKVTVGDVGQQAAPVSAPPAANDDEVTSRALANPEVQRFREVFGGEVRKVRNLKE